MSMLLFLLKQPVTDEQTETELINRIFIELFRNPEPASFFVPVPISILVNEIKCDTRAVFRLGRQYLFLFWSRILLLLASSRSSSLQRVTE